MSLLVIRHVVLLYAHVNNINYFSAHVPKCGMNILYNLHLNNLKQSFCFPLLESTIKLKSELIHRYVAKSYKKAKSVQQYQQDVICQMTARRYMALFNQHVYKAGEDGFRLRYQTFPSVLQNRLSLAKTFAKSGSSPLTTPKIKEVDWNQNMKKITSWIN